MMKSSLTICKFDFKKYDKRTFRTMEKRFAQHE